MIVLFDSKQNRKEINMEEEMKKPKKSRYTPAQNRAAQKYQKAHLDDIKFRVPKGHKAYYYQAAVNAEMSFAKFVVAAMREKIERDGLETEGMTLDLKKEPQDPGTQDQPEDE